MGCFPLGTKLIMAWIESLGSGQKSSSYKYALLLERNYYIDLTSMKELIKRKRTFAIWQWCVIQTKARGTLSGWRKILSFRKGKWEKEEEDNSWHNVGPVMMPAHVFFKTTKEFKKWVGEKATQEMFSECL